MAMSSSTYFSTTSTSSKKILLLQNHIIVGLISLILVYTVFCTTWDHFMRGARNPTILETPIALVTAIIPIGGAVLLLEVILKIGNSWGKRSNSWTGSPCS